MSNVRSEYKLKIPNGHTLVLDAEPKTAMDFYRLARAFYCPEEKSPKVKIKDVIHPNEKSFEIALRLLESAQEELVKESKDEANPKLKQTLVDEYKMVAEFVKELNILKKQFKDELEKNPDADVSQCKLIINPDAKKLIHQYFAVKIEIQNYIISKNEPSKLEDLLLKSEAEYARKILNSLNNPLAYAAEFECGGSRIELLFSAEPQKLNFSDIPENVKVPDEYFNIGHLYYLARAFALGETVVFQKVAIHGQCRNKPMQCKVAIEMYKNIIRFKDESSLTTDDGKKFIKKVKEELKLVENLLTFKAPEDKRAIVRPVEKDYQLFSLDYKSQLNQFHPVCVKNFAEFMGNRDFTSRIDFEKRLTDLESQKKELLMEIKPNPRIVPPPKPLAPPKLKQPEILSPKPVVKSLLTQALLARSKSPSLPPSETKATVTQSIKPRS